MFEARSQGGVWFNSNKTIPLVSPVTRSSYVLVGVHAPDLTTTISVASSGGTYVRAARMAGAARAVELWVGYGFGSTRPTSVTVSGSPALGSTGSAAAIVVDTPGDTSVAPAFTVSAGGTGTGASADPGALTPAVGDLLFAGSMHTDSGSASGRTATGNVYPMAATLGTNGNNVDIAFAEAANAVSTTLAWAITTGFSWAAIQVRWTPPAPPAADPGLLTKGLDTAALDAASAY